MLAACQGVPLDTAELDRWAFHNSQAIMAINQAIDKKYGNNLPSYPLYPLPLEDTQQWLLWNSQSHTAFNGVLGLQSHNLEDVDFGNRNQLEAWIYLNYQELLSACNSLDISP